MRRIFGPKRNNVTREWRKLYNEELNDLYCSPNVVLEIKKNPRIRWAEHAACIVEKCIQGFGGET